MWEKRDEVVSSLSGFVKRHRHLCEVTQGQFPNKSSLSLCFFPRRTSEAPPPLHACLPSHARTHAASCARARPELLEPVQAASGRADAWGLRRGDLRRRMRSAARPQPLDTFPPIPSTPQAHQACSELFSVECSGRRGVAVRAREGGKIHCNMSSSTTSEGSRRQWTSISRGKETSRTEGQLLTVSAERTCHCGGGAITTFCFPPLRSRSRTRIAACQRAPSTPSGTRLRPSCGALPTKVSSLLPCSSTSMPSSTESAPRLSLSSALAPVFLLA